MKILKAGVVYFVLVFGAGFIFGPIRILWVAPRLGARAAELMEAPIMFVVIIFASRWTVRRLAVPPAIPARLGMGLIALVLLAGAELGVALGLQGSITRYIETRDPIAGTVYLMMLAIFAMMPVLVLRR